MYLVATNLTCLMPHEIELKAKIKNRETAQNENEILIRICVERRRKKE